MGQAATSGSGREWPASYADAECALRSEARMVLMSLCMCHSVIIEPIWIRTTASRARSPTRFFSSHSVPNLTRSSVPNLQTCLNPCF
jgi:hypothetical protein